MGKQEEWQMFIVVYILKGIIRNVAQVKIEHVTLNLSQKGGIMQDKQSKKL